MTTATAKRTYKCGACGGSGHNKATCPQKGAAAPKGKVTKLRVIASKDSPKTKKFPKAKVEKPKTKAKPKAPKPPKNAVAPKLKKGKSAPNVFCDHSKVESFEDEGGKGIFSECSICGSRGPCKKTLEEALAALKKIKAVRPHAKGGIKPVVSTRKKLDGTDKMRGYVLEDRHVEVVKAFTTICEDKGTAKGYSAAMRLLLSNLTEKDLKRLAKAPK